MPHLLIVSARFYPEISDAMLKRAQGAFRSAGASWDEVEVPGCLEIPTVIRFAVEANRYDGYVALGCVIRGETFHYEIVCNESARGLTWLAIEHQATIGNGILTVENEAQAMERLDKGKAAAEAALKLIDLKSRLAP